MLYGTHICLNWGKIKARGKYFELYPYWAIDYLIRASKSMLLNLWGPLHSPAKYICRGRLIAQNAATHARNTYRCMRIGLPVVYNRDLILPIRHEVVRIVRRTGRWMPKGGASIYFRESFLILDYQLLNLFSPCIYLSGGVICHDKNIMLTKLSCSIYRGTRI